MQQRLERIERELAALLPDAVDSSWVEKAAGGNVVVENIASYRAMNDPALSLIKRGGKRWRPLLMVLIAESLGGEYAAEKAFTLSPVVEFPHTGSLIIDDIEDRSDWRRGEKAVHLIYGTDISINAGNHLYFLPTSLIDESPLPAAEKLQIYQIWARYMRRVHLGQGLDIHWHNHPDLYPSVDEYMQMCKFKTGCLAGMSAEIGAASAGSSEEIRRQCGEIAEKIGIGFQIRDDVENLKVGNPGKRQGDDVVEGKKSLPIILHVESCQKDQERIGTLFQQARTKGYADSADEISEVVALVSGSGALEKAELIGSALLNESLDALESLLPASTALLELQSLIGAFRKII